VLRTSTGSSSGMWTSLPDGVASTSCTAPGSRSVASDRACCVSEINGRVIDRDTATTTAMATASVTLARAVMMRWRRSEPASSSSARSLTRSCTASW
jgi:hypothetical protein